MSNQQPPAIPPRQPRRPRPEGGNRGSGTRDGASRAGAMQTPGGNDNSRPLRVTPPPRPHRQYRWEQPQPRPTQTTPAQTPPARPQAPRPTPRPTQAMPVGSPVPRPARSTAPRPQAPRPTQATRAQATPAQATRAPRPAAPWRKITPAVAIVAAIVCVAWGFTQVLDWIAGAGTTTAASDTVPEPRTPPLSFAGFDPGHIIDDARFSDPTTMDEAQIQAFLDKVGEGCRPGVGTDGAEVPCLAQLRVDTSDRGADRYCPRPFVGAAGDSAAAVIAKTARACNINPQVILTTLQKEQGLLTASSTRLVPGRYRAAMGFACPDNAKCDERFTGFERQVYYGAKQFQRYRVDAKSPNYSVKAGRVNEIKTGPGQCPTRSVHVTNWATAALYNYTPYVPTEAALAGSEDACNTPGNALFYAYFNAWFGGN